MEENKMNPECLKCYMLPGTLYGKYAAHGNS